MTIENRQLQSSVSSRIQRGWEPQTLSMVQQTHSKIMPQNVLQGLVEQITKMLQADRCFIIEFDEASQPLPIHIEARSRESVLTFKGLTPLLDMCPYLKKTLEKQQAWTADALTDDRITSNDLLCELSQAYSIRGVIANPIVHNDTLLCILVVHTQEPRQWNETELLLAQVISAQASSSISQSQAIQLSKELQESKDRYQTLYQWEKKTRQIFQTIRQSIDTDQVFPLAIEEMAKALNADRAFIIEFDQDKVCPIRYEYRSQESVKPFMGIVPPWDFCPYLAKSAQNEMAWSADTYNDLVFAGNEQWHHFSRKYTIRSIVTSPILYKEQLMNVVVFHTLEPKQWSEQELFFIKMVGDQLSTLFYQEKVREELIRAAQVKSDFLSKMSHELRTPLNTIIGYAKMVEVGMVGPLNEEQVEYMQYVSGSGEHLLNLLNDLLDFSKIEAGKMTIRPETIDILSLVTDIKPMVEEQAKRKNVSLTFQIQPGMGTVEVDPYRFKQMLLNLISNGIKFNHSEGSVSIRLNTQDGWLICNVQDTGIGIPQDKLSELFNRFHQIDNSASRQHEGTGLGLVLTKELVELHGGEISVSSEEEMGSTFTFKLPVVSRVV